MIPGGWKVFETIPSEYTEIFEGIKPKLTNGEYTILAVGEMSVGSKTICFICKALLSTGKEYFAKVLVHVPIGEAPVFQSAKEIFI